MSGVEVGSSIQRIIVVPQKVGVTPGTTKQQTIDARPNAGVSVVRAGPVGPASPFPGPEGPPGPPGPEGPMGPSSGVFTHFQNAPSDTWVIVHNLGFYPAVTIIDSAGSMVEGDVHYDGLNQLTVSFSGAFGGVASLS